MPVYSHSRLETFENCPLKYKFQYIDKLEKPEEESVEAFVGSRVHDALEKLYRDLILAKLVTLDELLGFYEHEWQVNWRPGIRIVAEGKTAADYRHYGAECIRNYYRRYQPFNQSRTLKTEARVIFPLDREGRYKVQGYIDRIARRDDGTYEIHDYKTSRHLPPQEEVDASRQLGLYQIGLGTLWRDVERVELIWHFVGFDTTLRSTRTPDQLGRLREETIAEIEKIEAMQPTEFEPAKSALCDWCEYRLDCPLWKHVDAVEALPPSEFAADAGVQLANQYAHTRFEMDRLKMLLDELSEQVLEFARHKQVRVLQGAGVQVKVNVSERTAFPAKDDPRRGELEAFLMQCGKWAEVVELSSSQLLHVLKDERWAPELMARLREFASRQTSETIRVARTAVASEEEE